MQFLAISLQRLLRPSFFALLFIALSPASTQKASAAQESTPAPAPQQPAATPTTPAETPAAVPAQSAPAPGPAPTPAAPTQVAPANPPNSSTPGDINEDEIKRRLVGKSLYLRGGFLGDSISFNEHGEPTGHPTPGSYTLSGVEIEKVRLSKHKVELIGNRYALHFLGAMPYEDPSKATERLKITPKKKVLKITIDREQVQKPKKVKEPKEAKSKKGSPAKPGATPATPTAPETEAEEKPEAPVPPAEQAADPASVTTTISPAHAAKMLYDAIDHIFADGLDNRLMAQMPEFWQLYYQAQAAGVDYRPKDPNVLRSSAVDSQAKLTSSIAPDSNEFAQSNGIAGRALYRAVIGPDGKPAEIAVVRPIGFGLDENAVAAIRKASFEPAVKGGQPVAETLDLAVLFRIYSKRTAVGATETAADSSTGTAAPTQPAAPIKPGPYTVKAQQQPQDPAPQQ